MDLQQLRYFVTAVEQHSMSAAARVCRVTQPTLSAQIRRIEEEANEVLFGRTAVGLHSTKSAQRLYQRLSPLLEDAVHGFRYVRGGAARPIEVLSIGIDYSAASLMGTLARQAAHVLEARHPHVKMALQSADAARSPGGPSVADVRIHHGLRRRKDPHPADTWLCVGIGVHAGRDGSGPDDAALKGVLDLPALPHEVRDAVERALAGMDSVSFRSHETDAKELILAMLTRNHGRVLVPRLAISPLILNHPRLHVCEVKAGLPSLSVVIAARSSSDRSQNEYRTAFQQRLKKLSRNTQVLPPADPLPDTRRLRYFLRAFDEGGVTRAAIKLNVVQPAVSMQIGTLERSLKRKLFERTPQGILPTAFGHKVHAVYGPILGALEIEARPAPAGRLRTRAILKVGILPGLDEDSLVVQATTATIVDWRAAFPNVDLKVVESHSGVLLDWLSETVIDVAIVEDMHAHTSLKETVLSSEPLAILTAQRSALCPPGPIKLADIGRLNLVLPSVRHGLRALLERKFADAGLPLVPKLELDSMASAIRLVKSGGWATVMPSSAVQRSLDSQVLQAHPIVRPAIMRELRAVQLPRHLKRPWAKEFIDFLRVRLSSGLRL